MLKVMRGYALALGWSCAVVSTWRIVRILGWATSLKSATFIITVEGVCSSYSRVMLSLGIGETAPSILLLMLLLLRRGSARIAVLSSIDG